MAKRKADNPWSRTKLVVLGTFLALCVLAWMFVLGVLVGRGTAPAPFDPQRLEKELASLRAQIAEQKKQQQRQAAEKLAADRLEFYRRLKDPRPEPLPPQPAPQSAPAAAAQQKPPVRLTALKHRTKQAPGRQAQPSPAPAGDGPQLSGDRPAPAQPLAAPAALQPSGRQGYTVQVASVRDRGDAARMVQALKGQGFSAYRVQVDLGAKGIWYRVRVGPFATADQAGRAARKLRQAGRRPLVMRLDAARP